MKLTLSLSPSLPPSLSLAHHSLSLPPPLSPCLPFSLSLAISVTHSHSHSCTDSFSDYSSHSFAVTQYGMRVQQRRAAAYHSACRRRGGALTVSATQPSTTQHSTSNKPSYSIKRSQAHTIPSATCRALGAPSPFALSAPSGAPVHRERERARARARERDVLCCWVFPTNYLSITLSRARSRSRTHTHTGPG